MAILNLRNTSGYMYKYANEDMRLLNDYGVTHIVDCTDGLSELEGFRQFLLDYKEHEVVIVNLNSLGKTLTLIQLLDCLLWMRQYEKTLTVLQQGTSERLSANDFQTLLIQLGELDRRAIRTRTQLGLKKAGRAGRFPGRPQVNQATINRIFFLCNEKKMTVREVAEECGVSIGTVSKYSQI